MLRMHCDGLHEGGAPAYTRMGALRPSNVRGASAIGRPLCAADRCSDIFKDRLRARTFNLKQRSIEEAG